jgi:site-specific recombinase XerD
MEIGYYGAIPFRDSRSRPRSEQARVDVMKVRPEALRLMLVGEAIDLWWLNVRKPMVRKERTIEANERYISKLKQRLGSLHISELHIGHLLEYQQHRMAESCVSSINHETGVLAQVLKYCDMWPAIEKHFRPLPEPAWTPPKVLTAEEEERFFKAVAVHPGWKVAYWAVSLTSNTSAMGTELRNLQARHVFLDHKPPKFHIPDRTAKNEWRARVIPLNAIAEKQMRRIWGRAEQLARKQGFPCLMPDHYLFPFTVSRNHWDVTRPASRSFLKKTFAQMREVTGIPWLQPRNFRNQLITKLFESGAPDETIISIAGHQSIKMSRYYSRIRLDRKFEVLSAVNPKTKEHNAG